MLETHARDPHAGQPILRTGADVRSARLVVVLVPGRGGSAVDRLELGHETSANHTPSLARQGAGSTWSPSSFLAPMEHNEPGLSSGLEVVADVVAGLRLQQISPDRLAFL